jgi:dCMP deaminase
MIIGLTGSIGSGKGIVSDFLKEKDFVYLSLSDELREIAKEKKIELTRHNLQDLGNELRKEKGASVLAERVKNKIKTQKYINVIVDGIRNPAEIKSLRKLDNFFLISVDAPKKIRFERVKKRSRESDPLTWEEFEKIDKRDFSEKDKKGQQVGRCIKLADFKLINDKTLEDAEKKLEEILRKIEIKIPRPDWNDYFMKMALLVSERSTCLRRHVGAIIVKEKRVLTTGYNGAAKNMKDCIELGCLRDELNIESGTRHEICRAIHAEQNAIIQAGSYGINIKNGIMYCTHTPCMICAKMIVNSGIKEVISYQDYSDKKARNFLKSAGIKLKKIKKPNQIIISKD